MTPSEYKLISENPLHLIYKKEDRISGKTSIVKKINSPFPSETLIAQLKNEYENTRKLNISGLRQPIDFKQQDGNYSLELEYIDGLTLDELKEQNPDIPTILKIFIDLCDILHHIHAKGHIHGSINGSNIMVQKTNGKVTLIDGSLISRFMLKVNYKFSIEFAKSILPYISPEQSGRTSKVLDHRTDLYSLGVTLYQLLTARLPFFSKDPLDLIYSHLTRFPKNPSQYNPKISPKLEAIILKLLKKNAEDRYQSALGLKWDLEQVVAHWDVDESFHFELGERDFTGQLVIPQKLYGRSKIVKELYGLVQNISTGNRMTVFISGESGTGKTAVVQELKKPITKQKGFYLEGKFDQLDRNIPYSGWVLIFEDFIQQVLTSGEKSIQEWTVKLKEKLGKNINVLHKLIPSLQFLIKPEKEMEVTNTEESQNRLNDLLANFFQIISKKEHPVIVFIDDLQWADNASINLLKQVATSDEFKYLLLVGAYRSDEIEQSSQLVSQMTEMRQAGIQYADFKISNLGISSIQEMTAECLSTTTEEVDSLSHVIYEKTQGNPYFINQFLRSIHQENLLVMDHSMSLTQKKPVWNWNIEEIKRRYVSSNVVELLIHKIRESSQKTIEVLKSAACIGSNFTLSALSTIKRTSEEEIFPLLENAVEEKYIYYKYSDQIHSVDMGGDVEYQFAHDKIQQAFYTLIPADEKSITHYEIGRVLSLNYSEEELQKNIFEVVFHLNFGSAYLKSNEDIMSLARLNFQAGLEAKKISAFDAQYKYLYFAMQLLGERAWQLDQKFAINIETEYLTSLYLTNRFEEAEDFFQKLISKIPTNIGKAAVYYEKMNLYQQLSKIDNILDVGLEGLELLGMKFDPDMNRLALVKELIKTSWMMRRVTTDDIAALPEMTDPKMRIAFALMYKIQVFAFDRNENLMGVLSMRLLQLMIKYGVHGGSMSGLISYGGILAIGFRKYDSAMKFNRLAIQLAEKVGTKGAQAMTHFGIGMTGYTSIDHEESLFHFQKSVDLAVEAGAHIDAAPGTMYLFALNFLQGMRLSELRQIVINNLYLTSKIKTENFHLFQLASLSIIDELKLGRSVKVKSIREEAFSYEEIDRKLSETEHQSILVYSSIFQMLNHLLFDRTEEALALEKIIESGFNVTRGSVLGLYYRLIQIMLYSRITDSNFTQSKRTILKAAKEIDIITKHNPQNFSHWNEMAKAAVAWVRKNPHLAQEHFDKSLTLAEQKSYSQDIGIIALYCAHFNKNQGFEKIAKHYYKLAEEAFRYWGAEFLADHISTKFDLGQILYKNAESNLSIDQQSLFKMSQLITGEIDIDALIRKLMNVFCENAGAERAILILKSDDQWRIEAEQKDESLKVARTLLDENNLSKSVCEFVIRTRKMVVLDEASHDASFGKTEYIRKVKPKSLVCMPLIRKGELTGLVYLENNLTSGVFDKGRIHTLNHISSQIAVAIDNARLYSDLNALNQAYERFVPREFLGIMGKKSITDVDLGDQVQLDMTVLFADIQGFTSLSEMMSPSETFSFINEFLSRMSPIIRRYNGFVDKFIGDEIMALFPNSADDAVHCGIAMLHELNVFSQSLQVKNIPKVQIGIGVNTGKLMLGTVGVRTRMNSTVISDTVNTASRVEKDTRDTGAPFMITKSTYERLEDQSKYHIRKLRSTTYKGKSKVTSVYEVFDSDDEITRQHKKTQKRLFEEAILLFEEKKYIEAKEILTDISNRNPRDLPCQKLLQEIELINI